MAKHIGLGTNLLKSEKKPKLNIGGNGIMTDFYLREREEENKEGKLAPERDIPISHYRGSKYTINSKGEIRGLNGEVMKYLFYTKKHGPRVRIQIQKKDEKGKLVTRTKELNIGNLMEKYFGMYIPGRGEKIENPREYILVTKDGTNNWGISNLTYIKKEDYYKYKEKEIRNIASISGHTSKGISEITGINRKYVYKILNKSGESSKFQAYQELQRKIGIEFSEDNYEIYRVLIECEGKLSNMEIAKLLWPKEIGTTKDKSFYTNKVVRARKRLTDKGIIPRFNELFESKRLEIIERIKNKANSGETSQQIADAFGLNKEQIYNLIRQIKKEAKK